MYRCILQCDHIYLKSTKHEEIANKTMQTQQTKKNRPHWPCAKRIRDITDKKQGLRRCLFKIPRHAHAQLKGFFWHLFIETDDSTWIVLSILGLQVETLHQRHANTRDTKNKHSNQTTHIQINPLNNQR